MITQIDQMKCTGCGICVECCPLDTLRLDTYTETIPQCQSACPAGVDMRGNMYLVKMGMLDEAMKLIRQVLPFSAVTGRVCFHPCEAECARKEVDEAINIRSIERFIGDLWLREKAETPPRLHVAKVAVVGSGPAGLAAAYFLVKMGYRVTVFESTPLLGGMLRVGIPEYRLPRDILDAQISCLRNMGIEFKTNTTIGKELTIDDLNDMGYKAVLFAIGTQVSKKLEIEGTELSGVRWGLDFLKDVNLGNKVEVKDRVLVIGGGDVAMDVALAALRMGARRVELACLESAKQIPAHSESVQQATDEGIQVNFSWGPKRILGKNGKVKGMELVRCSSVFDKKGNFSPSFEEETTKVIDASEVIFAIGQVTDVSLLPEQIRVSKDVIATDPVTLETTLRGVFAAGDAVLGPSSVVEAIASARRAAISIDRYLQGNSLQVAKEEAKRIKEPPREGIEKKAREVPSLLPVDHRSKNFREVTLGLSKDMVVSEAKRCMTCGSKAYIAYPEDCMTCFQCELGCPYEAIDVHPFKEELPLAVEYPEGGRKHG